MDSIHCVVRDKHENNSWNLWFLFYFHLHGGYNISGVMQLSSKWTHRTPLRADHNKITPKEVNSRPISKQSYHIIVLEDDRHFEHSRTSNKGTTVRKERTLIRNHNLRITTKIEEMHLTLPQKTELMCKILLPPVYHVFVFKFFSNLYVIVFRSLICSGYLA